MLKIVLVYLQGSGGNLVARTLSLSEKSVPYVPKQMASEQATLQLSMANRLALYNNWNSDNWQVSENTCNIWYHRGVTEFLKYEQSDLWLIDSFHPNDFLVENKRQLLWNSIDQWQHKLLIDWNPEQLDSIVFLAEKKRQDLKHREQIKQHELTAFNTLQQMTNFDRIHWSDMLELNSYIDAISTLDQKYGLDLDFNLVAQLWTSWQEQTNKILYERS